MSPEEVVVGVLAAHRSLDGRCACGDYTYRNPESRADHIAAAVIQAVRSLPVSEMAELIGGYVEQAEVGTAEVTAYIVADDPAEAERFVDAVADYAMGLSNNAGCVGRLAPWKARSRPVGQWSPPVVAVYPDRAGEDK